MARPRKTVTHEDQGVNSPFEGNTPPPVMDSPVAAQSLADYIREHEDAAEALGVVVTAITHPDAPIGIHDGRYSGIRTFEGDPSATYSDGSKH